MARRQAVHRGRRQMHIRFAVRESEGKAAPQLSRGMVSQPQRGDRKWRERGHFSPEAATAVIYFAARLRLLADLSVPCLVARHTDASYRDGAVQICRVQAQPVDQGGAQPRLLE